MSVVSSIVLLLMIAASPASAEAAAPIAAEQRAEAFVVALKGGPDAMRALTDKDGVFVVGDIGMPFKELMTNWKLFKEAFQPCMITEISHMSADKGATPSGDLAPWMKGADPVFVYGKMNCGPSKSADFEMVTRNGLVTLFGIYWVHTNG